MRVYLSCDIEGVTGLVAFEQTMQGGPKSEDYDFGRRMMLHDVNAAVRGSRAAGATEILIKDSHGSMRNLLVSDLEEGVELISGDPGGAHDGMMTGIDARCSVSLLIGYHAMAGTQAGTMGHTLTGCIHRLWINDQPAGEIALAIATASAYGVPTALITSDVAGCSEAAALVPAMEQVAVKEGIARYVSRLKHPAETGPMIEAAAERAVRRGAEMRIWKPEEPIRLRVEMARGEQTDNASVLTDWKRLDDYRMESVHPDWHQAHRAVWALISAS